MQNTNQRQEWKRPAVAAQMPADWDGFVRDLKDHDPEALARFFDLFFDLLFGDVRS